MNILLVNKFLHPNGGSETYIFRLGEALTALGHTVDYFGMDHPARCVGNRAGVYAAPMDFHGGSKLARLWYPVTTIYSAAARRQLRKVLHACTPDVVHLNNFNFQLTPSLLLEVRRWARQTGRRVKIVYTAHDYQLVCPNHMLYRPEAGETCERCLGGHFSYCVRGRCIHGSRLRSLVGAAEGFFWRWMGVYRHIDAVICPTRFLQARLETCPALAGKTHVLLNFIDPPPWRDAPRGEYVLYFGRYAQEKGIRTLLRVCRELSQVPFRFAGSGPLEAEVNAVPNVENLGFQRGEALEALIRGARLSVYPSEWFENCPFSVMESQALGTPVLAAAIGGLPELVTPGRTGELFESGNAQALAQAILALWGEPGRAAALSQGCRSLPFDTVSAYCQKLLALYQ